MVKSFEVVGYTVDADLLCGACAESWAHKAGVDLDDVEACVDASVSPVFVDECGDCDLYCDGCGYQIWQGGDV